MLYLAWRSWWFIHFQVNSSNHLEAVKLGFKSSSRAHWSHQVLHGFLEALDSECNSHSEPKSEKTECTRTNETDHNCGCRACGSLVYLHSENLGYRTWQDWLLQGDGANLFLAGSPAPSKISLINNYFSFSLAARVGRMQQSRRLKARLSKALHRTALLSSIAGLWRKTKPGSEHSPGRTHCRALNNKLQGNALYYILDPTLPPHRLSASPRFTHWSCSRIHASMKADITFITHAH